MDNWISINDREPDTDTFIVWDDSTESATVMHYRKELWPDSENVGEWMRNAHLTYWMHLPDRPKDDNLGDWISVKDRLPDAKECAEYLVSVKSEAYIIDQWFIPYDQDWLCSDVYEVAYWMPIPSAPERGKNERI